MTSQADRNAYLVLELVQARRKLAAIKALLPDRPTPRLDGDHFLGFEGGPEHRTVGPHRAWCYDASEWCSPEAPCVACDRPVDNEDLRNILTTHQPPTEGTPA